MMRRRNSVKDGVCMYCMRVCVCMCVLVHTLIHSGYSDGGDDFEA